MAAHLGSLSWAYGCLLIDVVAATDFVVIGVIVIIVVVVLMNTLLPRPIPNH